MAKRDDGPAERNQNRGLEEKEEQLRDPAHGPTEDEPTPSPRRGRGQEAPVDAPEQLENPPQTEGPRERNNDAV